jgi:ribose transport system substrate-binding protein
VTRHIKVQSFLKTSCVRAGLLLTASLIGAGSAFAEDGHKIGYSSPFLTDPGQVVQVKFATDAAKKDGVTLLPPTNANGDPAKQITDIRNLVSAGAQAIVVGATDSQAIVPAIDFANSKNVPVIATDIPPNGGKLFMIVRADNLEMGAKICKAMGDTLKGKGTVLSLMGDQANAAGRDRTVGFNKCLAANYPDIKLIERPTYWKPEKATALAQTIVTATPDLSAIYMQSDSIMLSGVMSVLKSAGKLKKAGEEGHIYLASIDGTGRALQGIRDGYLDIVVSQPLDLYAQYSIHYAKAALDGKTFAEGPTDHGSVITKDGANLRDVLPSTVVTAANASDANLWGNGSAK